MNTNEIDSNNKVFNPQESGIPAPEGDLNASDAPEVAVGNSKESSPHVPFGEDTDLERTVEHTPALTDIEEVPGGTQEELQNTKTLLVKDASSSEDWISKKVVDERGVEPADAADVLSNLLAKTQEGHNPETL